MDTENTRVHWRHRRDPGDHGGDLDHQGRVEVEPEQLVERCGPWDSLAHCWHPLRGDDTRVCCQCHWVTVIPETRMWVEG